MVKRNNPLPFVTPIDIISETKRFPPVGRCVYCGVYSDKLEMEHVLPFGIAGNAMLLPKSSCRTCASITGSTYRFNAALTSLAPNTPRATKSSPMPAIFVVATAHLAKHETLRRQPIYWRRLAAASHASLVVRICGTSGIKPDDIVAWAMRVAGQAYFMSVVSELSVEPQWRPEWIVPNVLLADVAGRAVGAAQRLAEKTAVPESWKIRLDAVQTWIKENKLSSQLVPNPGATSIVGTFNNCTGDCAARSRSIACKFSDRSSSTSTTKTRAH
jgi:hypothetical protein